MKERIQQSVKILAPIGTLGGFISDVLTPLGPVTKWLFLCSLAICFIFLIFYVFNKKKLAQKYLPSSIILALIFGIFFLLNNNTEKGILADNTESIANLQKSLFNIQETVERVEDKVDIIDQKLDLGFDKIEELIKLNNPIENPITPKDFIVNAYLYQSSGLSKKSQSSFEKYFKLSEEYKVDVLLDYCDVFESNNGYMSLKSQLELLPITETTELVKLLIKSIDDISLYLKLVNENNLNKDLSKWAVLTLPPSLSNAFGADRNAMFMWVYNCMTFHESLGYYCEDVQHFFFNKAKARELLNTNTFTKQPGYFFYVDYKSTGSSTNYIYPLEEEFKEKVKELDNLYLSKREEGWFR